jgi:RimJ/RimL family protein N-acetyltransferase
MMIDTERLVLRPIGVADLEEFLALHVDPEVTRFVRSLDRSQAAERLELAEQEWEQRGHGMFTIRDHATNRFLGRAGLKYWPQFDETEVGWMLHHHAWGHGYATEASRACIDWGFQQLPMPYLTAMIQPQNTASFRVAERLGLTPLRTDVLLGDEVVVYALSRKDWEDASVYASPIDALQSSDSSLVESNRSRTGAPLRASERPQCGGNAARAARHVLHQASVPRTTQWPRRPPGWHPR